MTEIDILQQLKQWVFPLQIHKPKNQTIGWTMNQTEGWLEKAVLEKVEMVAQF